MTTTHKTPLADRVMSAFLPVSAALHDNGSQNLPRPQVGRGLLEAELDALGVIPKHSNDARFNDEVAW